MCESDNKTLSRTDLLAEASVIIFSSELEIPFLHPTMHVEK